ncbi:MULTISPECIES: hypothetical protein [unclassified Streptomyces]|uniref:hypothetical protein n=1 Tax=unclassified Streptomyces TaxID=2593676 RepID=UPI0011B06CDD|nr:MULTISPECIES: hypothetical protein [unclassified Streptomyces]
MIESIEEFLHLSASDDPREHRKAITEEAPEQIWIDLINGFAAERAAIAMNKTLPLSVLDILSRDPDSRVRSLVAMKKKLTPEILDRLARDEYEPIRHRVAQHKNTSMETLEVLRRDSWEQVRETADEHLRGRTTLERGPKES